MIAMIRRRSAALVFPILTAAWLFAAAPAAAQPVEGPYMTTAEVLVRKGPGANHEVVATIPKGIKIHVVGKEGYWLKVQSKHGNPPGYIDDRFARPLETQSVKPAAPDVTGVYVTTADANVREGPGLHYKVLATIPKGIRIHVVGSEGNWLKVQSKHGNTPGYVEKQLTQRETSR